MLSSAAAAAVVAAALRKVTEPQAHCSLGPASLGTVAVGGAPSCLEAVEVVLHAASWSPAPLGQLLASSAPAGVWQSLQEELNLM